MILEATFALAIDGDTLRIRDERIRLWGIQAPEMREVGGPEAKQALQALVVRGVVCHVWTKDRYGRHVGMCFTPTYPTDVAWTLRATGHAQDWPKYSKGYYR